MMGWLGSTNKFGFERGTDFPKKVNLVNFGAVAKGSQMANGQKSTSSNSGQNEFSLYQRVPNNFLGPLGVV